MESNLKKTFKKDMQNKLEEFSEKRRIDLTGWPKLRIAELYELLKYGNSSEKEIYDLIDLVEIEKKLNDYKIKNYKNLPKDEILILASRVQILENNKIDITGWTAKEIKDKAADFITMSDQGGLESIHPSKGYVDKVKSKAAIGAAKTSFENWGIPREGRSGDEMIELREKIVDSDNSEELIAELKENAKLKGSAKSGMIALKSIIRMSKQSSKHKKEDGSSPFFNLLKHMTQKKKVSLQKWYKVSVVPKEIEINECDVLDFENYQPPFIFRTLELAKRSFDMSFENIENFHENYKVVISELTVSKKFNDIHECDDEVELNCPCKIVIFTVHDSFNNDLKSKMMKYEIIEGELFTEDSI